MLIWLWSYRIAGRLIKKNLTWWIKHGILNIKHSNHFRLFTLCLSRMEMCSKIVYSAFSTPFLVQFFSGKVVLSLRIFDEIRVATIATDKTTILGIRRSHCHFDEVWQRQSFDDGKEICQKVYCMFKVLIAYYFRFLYFLVSLIVLVVVAQPRKTILDIRPFRWKTADLMKNARLKRRPQVTRDSKVFL